MRPVHSALGLVAAQGLRCLSRVGILRIHATQGRIGRLQMLPVGAGLPAMTAPPADAYPPDTPQSKCGSWLACEGGLPADAYPPDTPQSKCGSWLACDDGLTVNTVGPGTYPFLR